MLTHKGLKLQLSILTLATLAALLVVPPKAVCAAKVSQSNDPTEATRLTEIPIKQIVIDDKFWSPRLEVNRTKL